MHSNDWIYKNKSKLCAVSKALVVDLNFPPFPIKLSWFLTEVLPFIAGAPEAAAFDGETGVPHGAAEVRWDEGSSADGAAGSCAECRWPSRTTSTWPTFPRPTSRHAPWTPRTSRAPRPRISLHASSHGSPPCPSDRSACTRICWFCVWSLLSGCSFFGTKHSF